MELAAFKFFPLKDIGNVNNDKTGYPFLLII